jgi:hypothetical protein
MIAKPAAARCRWTALSVAALLLCSFSARAANPERPKSGPVQILKASEIKPGMHAVAWTVFEGSEPVAVPIEIIGAMKNMWGPGQDVIIGKMGGRAERTNVAAGMSGSPVYIDGKLIGAVALRLSTFSPDAICGITPIEYMLEINKLDDSRPRDARTPDRTAAHPQAAALSGDLVNRLVAAGASPDLLRQSPLMVPVESPLAFNGFTDDTLRQFSPLFQQMGIQTVATGSGSTVRGSKPAADWKTALQPGESVAGVLISGDMSATGLGTVTYNDGKRVLAFGHPFFDLGPVDMPMSKGEVLMVLGSAYQPAKLANATEIVGALHQDRHSGIMGTLGDESPMIPVTVNVRSFNDDGRVSSERKFTFNVFQHQKWTPTLMMMTLYNSLSGLNEFREEATYKLTGKIDLAGGLAPIALTTMQASSEQPVPAPMLLAGWWGDRFSRLYLNPVKTAPVLQDVSVTVDLLPERRVVSIENAWISSNEARPGDDIPIKVFLRPYRGERIERQFTIKLPPGIAKGEQRILLSDADTLNRVQNLAGAGRFIDIPQTVSLLNQERSNDRLYVSLLEASPTAYYDDKTLPALPLSVLNVMQSGRSANRALTAIPESASEQLSLPFDSVVTGSYTLKVDVK